MFKKILLVFCTILLATNGWGQKSLPTSPTNHEWTVEELPMPHLQDSMRYTVNPDNILSQSDVDSLDAISRELRQRYGVEMICVVVSRVAGGEVYEWGDSLFNKYGFGKKGTDNGLLIVVSTLDREWRIFPGKGMEGVLPDAVCNRIGNRLMVPDMKNGEWGSAMRKAANAVNGVITADPDYAEFTSFEEESDDDIGGALGVIGGIGLGVGALVYFGRKKCPKCKTYMKVTQRRFIGYEGTKKVYELTYVCPKCGHSETNLEKVDINRGAAAAGAAGSILGSMGGRSGGGFSGGSFGGGSFGGGGAGGRF